MIDTTEIINITQFLIGIIGTAVTATAVNSLVRNRISSISVLILMACFVDFIYSAYFSITSLAIIVFGAEFGGTTTCGMSQIITTIEWLGGIWSILAVSILIYYKTFDARRMSDSENFMIGSCIWLVSLGYATLPLTNYQKYIYVFTTNKSCSTAWHSPYPFTIVLAAIGIVSIILGLVALLLSEARFFKKYFFLKKEKQIKALHDIAAPTQTSINRKMETKLITRSILQTLISLLCWIPQLVLIFYSAITKRPINELEIMSVLAMLLKNVLYSSLVLYYETPIGKKFIQLFNFRKPQSQPANVPGNLAGNAQRVLVCSIVNNAKTVRSLDTYLIASPVSPDSPFVSAVSESQAASAPASYSSSSPSSKRLSSQSSSPISPNQNKSTALPVIKEPSLASIME